MQQATSPTQTDPTTRSSTPQSYTLDTLARLDSDALDNLYRRSQVPAEVSELDGDPAGRMLAVKHVDKGPLAALLRTFAGSPSFPWEGKSMQSKSAHEGVGINRVRLGGRHKLFPFRTRIENSKYDGEPTLILDYDLPENPGIVRSIHDEIRRVSPHIYLGPAMWKKNGGADLVLWFALDTSKQLPFSLD